MGPVQPVLGSFTERLFRADSLSNQKRCVSTEESVLATPSLETGYFDHLRDFKAVLEPLHGRLILNSESHIR
ncbi:hypothetical protein SAMN05421809_1689 [Natronorubrum daqingense]|uniref:Uncharacterized protein n=1 Tax=Natronorubrum daqingense TaxID=588898 RepID=A0A1N7CGH8_9EURY|nr:hypothetical protein BB347_09805 [Natronorubrum daqingense]SIR62623.1 hypothetical protein SAMN05421809_1689 [Natronorubrum daqingense]